MGIFKMLIMGADEPNEQNSLITLSEFRFYQMSINERKRAEF
jgi:hypothetical protein